MTDKQYKKISVKPNEKVLSGLKELATYVVDNECLTVTGSPIVGAARDTLINEFTIDMILGSRFTKNKYLLIGTISGIAIASGLFIAYKIINVIKKEEEA